MRACVPLLLALILAGLLPAQNPQPAVRGLLTECNPPRYAYRNMAGFFVVKGTIFTPDNRFYGIKQANYVTYEPDYQKGTPFYHFCVLPMPQAVAWSRAFHAGITQDYVQQIWGTPNQAQQKRWLYWMPAGTVYLYWKDGMLEKVWLNDGYGPARRTISRNLDRPDLQGTPLGDKDEFGAMPAPAYPAAMTSARSAPATAPSTVTLSAAEGVAPGAVRAEIVAKLGAPHQRSAIAGTDGLQETLTYRLAEGGAYRFRLVQGKLMEGARR